MAMNQPIPQPSEPPSTQNSPLEEPRFREILRLLLRHRSAVIGGVIVLFFLLVALLADFVAPYDYAERSEDLLQPPSAEHWFGTDETGRDIFSRVLYGTRISLRVGFFAITGSIIIGSFLGLIAGFYGGWRDVIISRLFDILLAFPSILLAIAIVAMLGPGLNNALLAIAIINIPTFGRLMRSQVLSVKQEDFVLAARAMGMTNRRILFRHILPNSWTPIMVQGTLGFATAVIAAAALGFLGLGAQPPHPEWGTMLADARGFIQLAPWTMVFPGLAMMLTVLGFNLLGDGLRDVLDPRMKR